MNREFPLKNLKIQKCVNTGVNPWRPIKMIFLGRSEKEPFSTSTNTPQRTAGIQSQPAGIQQQSAGIQQVQTQQAQHRIGRKSGVIQPLGLLTNQGAKINQPEVRSPQPEVSRPVAVQPEVRSIQPEVRTPVNPTSVTIKKVPQSKQDLSRTNRLGSLIQKFSCELCTLKRAFIVHILLCSCVCLRTESLVRPRNPSIQLYLRSGIHALVGAIFFGFHPIRFYHPVLALTGSGAWIPIYDIETGLL